MIDIIKIKGITCQACVSRIEKKLLKNEYISNASINFLTNELTVEYEEMNINNSEIIELIKSIGYDIEVPYSNVILDIEGMTCQACSLRIEKKISKLEGISKINVNLATNIAEIIFNENQIKLSEIKSSIENLGYKAFSHKEFSEEKKEKNNSLYKLILAIIFTVPIF
ncbi:MAG: heavy-metal-associated domain-containing protein, partial [Fusobacteriaceae bacterium]|nr:heavy-metal-associated domain-containing protein [Fusobacteriaceae bacterium]